MAKYGKKASDKVEKAMHERKEGTLKSGRSGKKVTSRNKRLLSVCLRLGRKAQRSRAKSLHRRKSKTSPGSVAPD
jgi:hypothetical protein